jgi:hypothetical protein
MTLDEYFNGKDESRQLFESLRSLIETVGTVEIRVTKSQVAFRRGRTFAWAWMPAQYVRGRTAPLVLTISLHHRDESSRWKEIVEPVAGRFTHHLEVSIQQARSMTRSMVGCGRRGKKPFEIVPDVLHVRHPHLRCFHPEPNLILLLRPVDDPARGFCYNARIVSWRPDWSPCGTDRKRLYPREQWAGTAWLRPVRSGTQKDISP